MNDKIRPDHLDRAAYVYVRQSTLQQAAVPSIQVGLVHVLHRPEMRDERHPDRIREHHAPIQLPLAAANRDLAALEIEILDAERK